MTPSNETAAPAAHADENHLIAERRAKLAALRAQGVAFPNDFRRADYAGDLQAELPMPGSGRPRRWKRRRAVWPWPAG